MATSTITLKTDTTANWEASNRVLVANEPALERTKGGDVNMKIGDGITPWNDLEYAFGVGAMSTKEDKPIIINNSASTITVTLDNNVDMRCGEVTEFNVTLAEGYNQGYISSVSFTSGSVPTEFNITTSSLFSGDDCIDNIFIPVTEKRYNMTIWWDGSYVIGLVVGNAITVSDDNENSED